jgi:hypothetical protein
MRRSIAFLAALVALCTSSPRSRAAAPTPVLVELFTSEGCSSCPPADDLLARLIAAQPIEGARIVALGEHVDYWDQLGWKDRFSSAAFTNRQQVYATRLNNDGPYTPQLVIDGRAECVGSDATSARRAIVTAAAGAHGTIAIEIAKADDAGRASPENAGRALPENVGRALPENVGRAFQARLKITATALPQRPTDRAEIVLAITEDHLRTDVTRGENHGRTLSHVAVVRQLTTIGEAIGAAAVAERAIAIAPDWQRDRVNVVAFVQQRRNGAVLASTMVPLVPRP